MIIKLSATPLVDSLLSSLAIVLLIDNDTRVTTFFTVQASPSVTLSRSFSLQHVLLSAFHILLHLHHGQIYYCRLGSSQRARRCERGSSAARVPSRHHRHHRIANLGS